MLALLHCECDGLCGVSRDAASAMGELLPRPFVRIRFCAIPMPVNASRTAHLSRIRSLRRYDQAM
jgi:hypothetical protein